MQLCDRVNDLLSDLGETPEIFTGRILFKSSVKNLNSIKIDRGNLMYLLMGQSIVLGEIKAEVPLQNENPLNHQILWQPYIERIESLSPESKVSKFCVDAGFVHVVEVGQYFMTKDTVDVYSGLS